MNPLKSVHVPWKRGKYPWERGPNSRFLRYYAWLCDTHGTLLERSSSEGSLSRFPAALPFPELLAEGDASRVDEPNTLWAKSFINVWIGWSNYVVLGCPDCGDSACEPRVGYRQWKEVRTLVGSLLGEVTEFVSSDMCTEALSCDGKRLSIEEALDQLKVLHGDYGGLGILPDEAIARTTVAMPVVADRVAIPDAAGTVSPLDWLPEERAEIVSDLSQLRMPETDWRRVPRACHQVSVDEEARLMRRLLQHNMVCLTPESELPVDSQGRLLTGGFFSVPKNSDEDRLIFDRRPENATMNRLQWAKLPSGACFCKLRLRSNQYLRGSGDDLRNYYYALALPENWVKYNSVGRRVSDELVREFGGEPGVAYRATLRVLGMGDINACDIAQGVHEFVLQSNGVLMDEHRLEYGKPLPESDLMEGAYLDDLLVVYRKTMECDINPETFQPPPVSGDDWDAQHAILAEQAYEKAGLQRAIHKSFRFQEKFKAWGAEIDGIQGRAGAPLHVRRQLWLLLMKTIKVGYSSKELLQRILGYNCFAFQYRREFYALQHHIYKFLETMKEGCLQRLPPHVLDELRAMSLHLPFCVWRMRRDFYPSLLSTDATPSAAGAARARLTEDLAEKLWSHCEVRGEALRLDRNPLTAGWLTDEEPKEPSRFGSALGECLSWQSTSSYHFRQTAHINLQEDRALRKEICDLASDPNSHGKIHIALNDSRVVVAAVAKGRSSSFRLNGILRSTIPFLVLADIAIGLIWVETSSNPADHPSRFKPIPPPSIFPQWLFKYNIGSVVAPGLEVFAGSARLTRAFRAAGIPMFDPIDILWGADAFDEWIDEYLVKGKIGWLWLAPPCSSFSPLRNLDKGGPLRPKGNAEGDERNPHVKLGNRLWRRAIQLAWAAYRLGIPFFIEHPQGSKAWKMKITQRLISASGVHSWMADWCAYEDPERDGPPNRKPTRVVGSGVWLDRVFRRCPGGHEHGVPLRGSRAKAAGAYPWGFCAEAAAAFNSWHGEVA